MKYVDGYLVPVQKKKLPSYRRLARQTAKIWREHGALEYRECAGDDLDPSWGMPFPRLLKTKPGETVIFAWIVFRSRAHRDHVNAKVMNDPRILNMCAPEDLPFDCKRIVYGGFKFLVAT